MKAGFTLAEVLITLGIIGVVSALTLPSVINNKQNKELETQLNSRYTMLQQALILMGKDNGDVIRPSTFSGTNFAKELKNYLKYIKYCTSNGCIEYDKKQYKLNNYKNYTKTTNVHAGYLDDGQIILNDGGLIMVENNPTSTKGLLFITIDINGFKKKPNAWGHDLFTFQLTENGKLLPMGAEGTMTYNKENTYCNNKKQNTEQVNGIGCTNKALNEKYYWKNLP